MRVFSIASFSRKFCQGWSPAPAIGVFGSGPDCSVSAARSSAAGRGATVGGVGVAGVSGRTSATCFARFVIMMPPATVVGAVGVSDFAS